MQAICKPAEALENSKLFLLVVGEAETSTHVLPTWGEVIIGRDPSCDIVINDPTISLTHAKLCLSPDQITVEDLGTPTGTLVRDRMLPSRRPTTLTFGETIEIGSTLIIVNRRSFGSRLLTHSAFEKGLKQVLYTANQTGSVFSLMRVHCDASHTPAVIEAALRDIVADAHQTGYYAPGHYEALFLDCDVEKIRQRAEQIVAELRNRGIRSRIGIAGYPSDARDADALIKASSLPTIGVLDADRTPTAVIGSTSAMEAIHRLAKRIAPSDISVLILGETGVGKDVAAEMIHRMSRRADKPLVRLNCAALSETLLASDLFGHERGAFTGAIATKQGLLETAEGGTVFLDEVGELPLALQAKLLHVLEEREVLRVGGLRPRPIDVRFIAATNRDLAVEVEAGLFRRDLYYRLNAACVKIPPLRERVDEILPLAQSFLEEAAPELEMSPPHITAQAAALLEKHHWPGNIRELKNVMARALLLCRDDLILPEHLELPAPVAKPAMQPIRVMASAPSPAIAAPSDVTSDQERQRILEALESCAGNQTQAARRLGISRRTLINRILEYGLPRPRKERTTPVDLPQVPSTVTEP